jgi:predicted transcriptional regulator
MTMTEHDDRQRVELRQQMARALARGGMENVHVVSHETAETVLTARRRELVTALKQTTPESVRGLARQLDRDKGAVSRDLAELAEHNIVTYEDNGRAKRPTLTQEHIFVEPVV